MKAMLNILDYYEDNHDRLNATFKKFQKMKLLDFNLAIHFFDQFKSDLQKHMIWEEESLFPYLQHKVGMSLDRPTQLMKLEHRQIGMLMERIHNLVRQGDPNSSTEEQEFLSFLAKHNSKEEQFLYPAIDQITSPEELKYIFKKMDDATNNLVSCD